MAATEWWGGLRQDLAYALRGIRRSPAFALVVVVTLALGIGAATAIFSGVNRLVLHPLPFKDPDRLVLLYRGYPRTPMLFVPYLSDVEAWRRDAPWFDRIETYATWSTFDVGGTDPETVTGTMISPSLPTMLGVRPVVGRSFTDADALPGAPRVALLGWAFWRRRFGSDPGVVGRTLTLNDGSYTIVGVVPRLLEAVPELGPINAVSVLVPLIPLSGRNAASTSTEANTARNLPVTALAHLAPGVTPQEAESKMRVLAARDSAADPAHRSFSIRVLRPADAMYANLREMLLALFCGVAMVMLIACANVANLLLARGETRHKEMAIRKAIGAGRGRLVRQLLVENLLLWIVSAGLGVLVAQWGLAAITGLLATGLDSGLQELRALGFVHIDRTAVLFSVGVSLITGLTFGLLPALEATRSDLSVSLRSSGGQARGAARGRRFRAALIVAEVAFSMILLASAGLLARGFVRLQRADAGFDVNNLLAFQLKFPRAHPPAPLEAERSRDRVLERLRSLPGVEMATRATVVPPWYAIGYEVQVEGQEQVRDATDQSFGNYNYIAPDYFKVMRLPLREGRTFTDAEARATAPVAVVNVTFARQHWPGTSAIGRRIRVSTTSPWATVVGVAADALVRDMHLSPGRMQVYFPMGMAPAGTFIVRTRGAPLALLPAIRNAVRAEDPTLDVEEAGTVESRMADALARPRVTSLLLGAAATLATLLAALGLFGVISYAVTQRTREIGIRMALGADARAVQRVVVADGLRLALLGLGIGAVISLWTGRLISGLLFGVSPRDPVTFVSVAGVVVLVAVAASYVPARRAARVDPLIAIRTE